MNQHKHMHKQNLDAIGQYCNALQLAGCTPKIGEDKDISFKIEGTTVFIEIEENNPAIFRIVLPSIYEIGKENLLYAVETLKRIKNHNQSSNVIFIQIADDEDVITFWITTELLTLNPTLLKDFILSKLKSLLDTRETIDKFLREHAV